MLLLDQAGTVLPEGLGFLRLGWWVIHILAFLFVYLYGYNKGRGAARREQRIREMERERQGGTPGPPP